MNKKVIAGLAVSVLAIIGLAFNGDYWHSAYRDLEHKVNQTQLSSTSEQSQLDFVNAIRAKKKLPGLKYDNGLNKTAKAKVQDMIDRKYFNHNTPDGQKFYALPFKIRPGLKYYGENIGKCYDSQEAMYKAYEASEEHYKNIVDPHYTLFGGYTQWDDSQKCFVNANEFGG